MSTNAKSWFVYILRCADDTLYTGVTTDVLRRVDEHNGLSKKEGAKCTRARRPVTLVYYKSYPDRSSASKREWEIKKMKRQEKEMLVKKN